MMRYQTGLFTRANIKASTKDAALLAKLIDKVKTDSTYSPYRDVAAHAIIERNTPLLDALLCHGRVALSTLLGVNDKGKLSTEGFWRQKMTLQFAVVEYGTLAMLDMLVASYNMVWAPERRYPFRFVMDRDNHISYALSFAMSRNRVDKLLRAIKRHPLDIDAYTPSNVEQVDLMAVCEDRELSLISMAKVANSSLRKLIYFDKEDQEHIRAYLTEGYLSAMGKGSKTLASATLDGGDKLSSLLVIKESDFLLAWVEHRLSETYCTNSAGIDVLADPLFNLYLQARKPIEALLSTLTYRGIVSLLKDHEDLAKQDYNKHLLLNSLCKGLVEDKRRLLMSVADSEEMRVALGFLGVTPMEAVHEYKLSALKQGYCLRLVA